jgi:hypothetical protein
MSTAKNHGGLKSFEPTEKLNDKGFIAKIWDNRVYPPFFNPEQIALLKNSWDTDENDIFICTHQKVGTHLTKKFVCEILRNAIDYSEKNGIKSGDIGHDTIPWPEVMISQHGMDHFLAHLEATKGKPRVWYTHCSMHDLPFRSIHSKTRFIHVFRDPKGAFVSQFHFYRTHPMLGVSQDLTYDQFLKFFIDGNLYFGDYHTHTLEWIDFCGGKIKNDSLLVLRYEDLVERKMDSVKALANFILLNNNLNEVQYEQIIEATEFNKMKQEISENPQSFHFNPQTFFRSGKCYDWMEKLNPNQIDQIDTKTKAIWGEENLSFPNLKKVKTLNYHL